MPKLYLSSSVMSDGELLMYAPKRAFPCAHSYLHYSLHGTANLNYIGALCLTITMYDVTTIATVSLNVYGLSVLMSKRSIAFELNIPATSRNERRVTIQYERL